MNDTAVNGTDILRRAGQRLWLDTMLQSAHQQLGQTAEADEAGKRIAGNPESLDAQHGKNVIALIVEVRQSAAQMEAISKMLKMFK